MNVRIQSTATGKFGAPRTTGELLIELEGREYSVTPDWQITDAGIKAMGLDVREVKSARPAGQAGLGRDQTA